MSIAQERLAFGPELAGALLTPEEFDAAEVADDRYRKPERRHHLLSKEFPGMDRVQAVMELSHGVPRSMIVHNFHIERMAIAPDKTNAPLVIYSGAPLTPTVP